MTDLIFLENKDFSKGKLLTTSLIVAKVFEIRHDTMLLRIKELLKTLHDFNLHTSGQIGFCRENTYKDSKNREYPMYEFDKKFFNLLVMRLHSKRAIQYQIMFVNAFEEMEQELARRKEVQMIGKEIRKDFTDTIKIFNSGENNDFVKWSYKSFTDLVYKIALGGTCKQLRIARNQLKIKNFRDTLTSEELKRVQAVEEGIKRLAINKGWIKLPNKEIYYNVRKYLHDNNILSQ